MFNLQNPVVKQSLQDLSDYISIPSVSAKKQSQKEAAAFVQRLLEKNLQAQVQVFEEYGTPLVFAEVKPKKTSDTTILIYNHYDVQPEEPLELWESSPFELHQTKTQLFGRGVADCKGDFISRVAALQLYYQQYHDFPCNIKFLLEGEEEVASQHLPEYLEKYQDLLAADLILWESGRKNEQDKLLIEGGNKGILCFELVANSADIDLHSSYAAVVDSATWRLTQALNSLRAADGTIKIPNFYDDIVKPSNIEQEQVQAASTPDLVKKWDLKLPLLNNESVNYNLTFAPTINIQGISSGWEGEGVKTVTPKTAHAKLDCRLVPNQSPEIIFEKIKSYLADQGFQDIQVNYLLGEKAYRWDLQSPLAQQLVATARQIYGVDDVEVLPSSAGTGPMYLFNEYTQAQIVSCGVAYSQSGEHAPNENIRIADYLQFIEFFFKFLQSLAGEVDD